VNMSAASGHLVGPLFQRVPAGGARRALEQILRDVRSDPTGTHRVFCAAASWKVQLG
jgi:hypothetical protein